MSGTDTTTPDPATVVVPPMQPQGQGQGQGGMPFGLDPQTIQALNQRAQQMLASQAQSPWQQAFGRWASSPVTGALMGAASGFGQAAMPTPYKMPFGAVLGMGMQGMQTGMQNAYRSQQEQAQAQNAQLQSAVQMMQVPAQMAATGMQLQMYQHPELLLQGLTPGGGGVGVTPPTMPQGPQQSQPAPLAGGKEATAAPNYAALYGDPTQKGWDAANLTTVSSPSGATFRVNNAAAPAFTGFLGDLEKAGYKINPQQSGGWNVRPVTGTGPDGPLSPHSYGVAIDINPQQNPYSKTAQGGTLTTDLPPNVGDMAAKWGLQWGGNWSSLKDPMHFEYVGHPSQTVAQGGGGGTRFAGPGAPPAQPGGAAPGGAVPFSMAVPQNPGQAMQMAMQLNARAGTIEQRLKLFPMLPQIAAAHGITLEDPTALRQQAQELMKFALAPGQAAGVAAATAPIETKKAIDIAAGTAPIDVSKAINIAQGTAPIDIAKTIAKAGINPIVIRGQGAYIYNPATQQHEWRGEQVPTTLIGSDGSEYRATQTVPEPGSGKKAEVQLMTDSSGAPVVAKPSPTLEAFRKQYGDDLAKQFASAQAEAAAAKEGNYQFDNMRTSIGKFAGWTPDMFAPARNEANQMFLALGHSLGLTDEQMPELNKGSANYVDFGKNAGQVLRTAVKGTGSRVGVQEYRLIGETLPSHATPEQTFLQLADQYQGLNDYHIAKEQFMRSYANHPQDFQADWDAKISPTAFMINRMAQTPEGQQRYNALIQRLVDSGHAADAQSMIHEYATAKGLHLFDELPGGQR